MAFGPLIWLVSLAVQYIPGTSLAFALTQRELLEMRINSNLECSGTGYSLATPSFDPILRFQIFMPANGSNRVHAFIINATTKDLSPIPVLAICWNFSTMLTCGLSNSIFDVIGRVEIDLSRFQARESGPRRTYGMVLLRVPFLDGTIHLNCQATVR